MALFNPCMKFDFCLTNRNCQFHCQILLHTKLFVRVGDLGQPDILEPFSVCSQLSSDRPTSQLYGAAAPAIKSLPSAPRKCAARVNTGLYHLCRGWRSCGGPAVVAHGGGSLNADAAHIGGSCFNLLSNLTNVNTLKSLLEAGNALAWV